MSPNSTAIARSSATSMRRGWSMSSSPAIRCRSTTFIAVTSSTAACRSLWPTPRMSRWRWRLPITQAIPMGKHVSVPIRMPDGSVYGMFCCLGFNADRSLRERDLQMLKVFADLVAFEIGRDFAAPKRRRKKTTHQDGDRKKAISDALPADLEARQRPAGRVRCLSRFTADPRRPPDQWFTEAAEVGLGTPLELAAIRLASVGARFVSAGYLSDR